LTDQFRVQVFDREGVFLHKWGSAGTGDGQFQKPIGVASDASGKVYAVDMGARSRAGLQRRAARVAGAWRGRGFGVVRCFCDQGTSFRGQARLFFVKGRLAIMGAAPGS